MNAPLTQRSDRARRAMYANSRDINGILAAMRATEAELIAFDLRDKVADKDAAALADQIRHQSARGAV